MEINSKEMDLQTIQFSKNLTLDTAEFDLASQETKHLATDAEKVK
jgi:hypothetical protein